MTTATCPADFVPCTIRFTFGVLEGISIPQNLPRSLAVVGRNVKSCTGAHYTVVAVGAVSK